MAFDPQVKETVDIYFQHLYTEDGIGNEEFTSDFLSHMPSLVSEENNVNLMKLFSEEEIAMLCGLWNPIRLQAEMDFHFISTNSVGPSLILIY